VAQSKKSSNNLQKEGKRKLTLGSGKMQYVSVLPEHVDLFHARDRLYVQLL
jgi:hypothetical protein